MEKKTNIPAAYLRERLAPVLFYVIEACLFMMVAALYGYEGVLANMTYALGLAAFFGGCFLVWDYMKYREKYKDLANILSAEERSDSLPQTSSGMERVYQQIVMAQEAEKKALVTQLDEKQQNMADYYTMWTHQIKVPLSAMDLLLQNADAVSSENGMADGGETQIARQLRGGAQSTAGGVSYLCGHGRQVVFLCDRAGAFQRAKVHEGGRDLHIWDGR